MEEQIKRAVRNLNISYVFFWVLPAFLLGAGEFDLLPVGALVDNPQATYYMETAGILLTALCVPLALKLCSGAWYASDCSKWLSSSTYYAII